MKQTKITGLKNAKLEDLFKNKKDIFHCIQALRQVVPAVVNDSMNFY